MPSLLGSWCRTAAGAGLLGADGMPTETIFAEMTALAVRTGAINLGQGFPDDGAPPEVLEAAASAILDGTNQYPPGRGILSLRTAIAEHQARFYGIALDPEHEVMVTTGATEALAAALLALIDSPEDEVVVLEPFYDAYAAVTALSGARLVTVPLRWPGFQPDLDEVRKAINDRTRVILINDPHNPTGAMFSDEFRDEIVALAERHDAIIVTDEVYEHLTFDRDHVPLATRPGAAQRTLTISSAAKTFAVTGWKVGWMSGPAPLIDAALTVKQFLTYSSGAPFQGAIATGLRLPDAYFASIRHDQRDKSERLGRGLRAAGFAVSDPAGTYFTVADTSSAGFEDAVILALDLPHRVGVVAIPLTAFASADRHRDYRSLMRFAACKPVTMIQDAIRRLENLHPATG